MPRSIEQTLSEELLDQIVSWNSRETLRSLCLSSKTLNRLATPYLYSNIYLRETDHLPALAYLLCTSPAHAALVKSFIVPDTWGKLEEKFTERSWPQPEDLNLRSVLRAKCAEYASSDEEASKMYEKIESGANEDAILALLLANLPDLRRLDINFGILNHHEDFNTMWTAIAINKRSYSGSQRNAKPVPAANRPKAAVSTALSVPIDIMVTGTDIKYPNFPIHVAIFMHLPNVRSIYGCRLGDDRDIPSPETNPFAKLQPLSCPVEYIELRCCKLHMENLHYLLGATIPGKLKTFSYEIGCSWAWCKVEHLGIMTNLQPHHDTLETLALSHEDYYPYEMADEEFENSYPCSFTPFTALKHLKVAPVYIWGHSGFTSKERLDRPETKEMLWKALPKNLEELWIARAHHQELSRNDATIRFVPDCLLPALDLVVQNKSHAFPNLAQLRIELPLLKWKDEWLDTLASLCRTAATNGIHSTIILFDMFDRYGKLTVERLWGWNEDVEWEPTRYSVNRECAKIWIDTANYRDLEQVLKDLKVRFEEENERLSEAKREIGSQGWLCTDCQLHPANDASKRIDMAGLHQWIRELLH